MSTPRYGHAPIAMRRVKGWTHDGDLDDDDHIERVGDFFWEQKDRGRVLVVAIPCSSKSGWTYSKWTIDHKNHCDAQWSWNGNEDRPTLNPSLHAVGVWHGWVRDGQLVEA